MQNPCHSVQNKCQTTDPDQRNLPLSGKLSFFVIYKLWQKLCFGPASFRSYFEDWCHHCNHTQAYDCALIHQYQQFTHVNFKLISMNDGWLISFVKLPSDECQWTDDDSTLVQVMAWCCQATSHNLGQCWLRSTSPCGITRPQWVKRQMHSYDPSLLTASNITVHPSISSTSLTHLHLVLHHRENSPITQTTPRPHCYLGVVDHVKKFPPPLATLQARSLRPYCSQTLWSCSGVSRK